MANIGATSNSQPDDHMVNFSNPLVKKTKIAPLHIEARSLTIGDWECIAQQPEGILAKWYFTRKRCIWEILQNNGLKKKIEISWSNLSAIRATVDENQCGIFQVSLKDLPLFFEEIQSTKNIHTMWKKSSDFTNGNAKRIHTLKFRPGVLEKHCGKLWEVWPLFKHLSERTFDESLQYNGNEGDEQEIDEVRVQCQQSQVLDKHDHDHDRDQNIVNIWGWALQLPPVMPQTVINASSSSNPTPAQSTEAQRLPQFTYFNPYQL